MTKMTRNTLVLSCIALVMLESALWVATHNYGVWWDVHAAAACLIAISILWVIPIYKDEWKD